MNRLTLSAVTAALFVVMTSAPARADWLITPFVGSAFGGDTTSQHVTYGASAAWMSHGIVGLEFDGSIAPDLLDEDDGVILGIADSNVTTVMGIAGSYASPPPAAGFKYLLQVAAIASRLACRPKA